jgi:hypothetical protein
MPSASSLKPDGRFLGLFVGPTKCGKTVAECSFPGPIRVFDFDGRIRGILGAPWINKDEIEYTYYPPRVGANNTPTYQKINEDLEALLVMCNTGRCNFKTVILDSLTSETYAMLCDAVALTKGKMIGTTKMAGPEDYGFEATNTYNIISFLRSLPIPNILVSAHVVDRFGKADPSDKYSETIVVGEKLSVRDKIGENVGIYFDHCFRFDREVVGNQEKFYVQFRSELASTSFEKLPFGKVDITGKPFYQELMRLAKGTEAGAQAPSVVPISK